jgi:hypothetical protein
MYGITHKTIYVPMTFNVSEDHKEFYYYLVMIFLAIGETGIDK